MTPNPSDVVSTSNITLFQSASIPEFSPTQMSWDIWKERLEIHFCEVRCTDDNAKKAILLKSIGAEAYSVIHSLCSPSSPSSKAYKDLCEMMHTQFTPPTIIFHERRKFHVACRQDEETVAMWFARVKKLALNCKFGPNLDAFVLDKFIVGLPNEIFERICEEDEKLTIEQALRKALIVETKLASRTVGVKAAAHEDGAVNFVKKSAHSRQQTTRSSSNNNKTTGNSNSGKNNSNKKKPCCHCGWRNHEASACKYRESKCYKCGKTGHLASVCKSRQNKNNAVNCVSDSDHFLYTDTDNDCVFSNSIFSVQCTNNASGAYTLCVSINNTRVEAECDTGAPCTLIPSSLYQQIKEKSILRKCKVPYVDYSGERIAILDQSKDIQIK
ncbi:uncharacterized protein [Eurosta solidaginis]|uniref:uncharacterized protein n=1 Tax=Eurosta solidaginis TaxID=178769 RepID=UPI003531595F